MNTVAVAPSSVPLPLKLHGSATLYKNEDAYPGSPFGDEAWRVNDNSLAPAVTKQDGLRTQSDATPEVGDQVVVVFKDGRTLHRKLIARDEGSITLARYKLTKLRYVPAFHETYEREDIARLLKVVGKFCMRSHREWQREQRAKRVTLKKAA